MPSKKFASTRTTGLIVAGAVSLIIAGVVLFVAVSQRQSIPPAPVATGDVTDIDVGSLVRNAVAGEAGIQDAVDGRVQFEDRDNPSRVQAELIYRRMNPVGGGFYELDQPRAWIYMKDGRALYVRADSGRVKSPNKSNSPESGQFIGNVVGLLFPARGPEMDGVPRDPLVDAPGVVARTGSIRFDAQLLEFASDEHVTIETPTLRFSGTSVLVKGNQVLDRIEYMRVARDGVIRYFVESRKEPTGADSSLPGDVADGALPQERSLTMADAEDAGWEVVPQPDLAELFAAATTEVGASNAEAVAVDDTRIGTDAPVDAPADPTAVAAADSDTQVEPQEDAPPQPMLPAAAVAAARARQQANAVKEDLYEAVFATTVRVTQRKREIAADTLFVWLRTLDNKLPDDAFGAPAVANHRSYPTPLGAHAVSASVGGARLSPAAAIPALLLASVQPSASEWPPTLFNEGENDVVLTWAGPLSVKPVAVSPPPRELALGNHLALRFSSKAEGAERFVRLTDAEIGARGGCEELEYFATSRDMTLTSGIGAPQVWLAAPEVGCLAGTEMRVNLATGVAEIPGPGVLTTLAEDLNQTAMTENSDGFPAWLEHPRPEYFTRQIDWQRRADFQFRSRDGEIRDALEWAEFRGRSFATDNRSSLAAELLRAEFVEVGTHSTVLRHLAAEGSVEALAAAWREPPGVEVDVAAGGFGDGVLRAANLGVNFESSSTREGEVDPSYLMATGGSAGSGGAVVGKDNAFLTAPQLEASMSRASNGDIVVTDFEARGNSESLARFDRGDGVWASGQRIKGHAQRETASVTGPRVLVARGDSLIDTTIVELDGIAKTMEVYAPGTFTHEQPTVAATGPEAGTVRVTATWVNSMTYDDLAGVLECRGDTKVVKEEPLTLDTVRADRIRIDLSGDSHSGSSVAEVPTLGPSASTSSLEADLGDRRVLRATAFGSLDERADGKPATVESRGFAAPAKPGDQRTLETISYIEAARLIADDDAGTIEAPVAGRAIVFDQRSPDASSEVEQGPQSQGLVAGSPRGTSSFRWQKSMLFTRATGMLDLVEKIEVVHKALDNRPLTRMTSDRLLAKLDLGTSTSASTAAGGKLIYADAIGSVYAESGPQRLVGEQVLYDAREGTAVATAPEGSSVTLFDDRRATPFTARRLKWDLVKDQIEILEPAPVVAPR